MQQVRELANDRVYGRIKTIVKDARKSTTLFNNENFAHTFVERLAQEPVQRRNERGKVEHRRGERQKDEEMRRRRQKRDAYRSGFILLFTAIASAWQWFSDHVTSISTSPERKCPPIILVTDEPSLLQLAQQQVPNNNTQQRVMTSREYVNTYYGKSKTIVELYESLTQVQGEARCKRECVCVRLRLCLCLFYKSVVARGEEAKELNN